VLIAALSGKMVVDEWWQPCGIPVLAGAACVLGNADSQNVNQLSTVLYCTVFVTCKDRLKLEEERREEIE
tara:strand:- start:204 stop:413 length:210 start_codon:yes stop_codon:yes gene_type:complete